MVIFEVVVLDYDIYMYLCIDCDDEGSMVVCDDDGGNGLMFCIS